MSRFETSAKDNTNIDEAARHLVTTILAIEREHLDRHDAENFENNNQQLRVDSRDKNRNDGGCCWRVDLYCLLYSDVSITREYLSFFQLFLYYSF